MAGVGDGRRARVPLALVVSRYFLYALAGAVIAVGISLGAFAYQMASGAVLAASYGEAHLPEVADALAAQDSFDPDAIPAAYRFARLDAHGAVVATDMTRAQLQAAREAAPAPGAGPRRGPGAGPQPFYAAVGLADGGRCVLCYEVVPQWADKGARDALPNPQDLLVLTMASSLALVITLVALRAARVLKRKMSPLAEAAGAVGRQELDGPVGGSDVAEIDDVLRAMDSMRVSLKDSLQAQRESERRSREQVAALAHDLKTPLTVALGNAELLAEDAEAGELGKQQAASARAIRDAALTMDAFVTRIVEASRGREDALHFAPTDPAALADRLEDAVRELVAACGLRLEATRDPEFQDACCAVRETGAPPLWDGDALERAILNLAGNACDHARSRVALSFSLDAPSGTFSIVVRDDGPGLSPEALEHGAERFYRDDASRANAAGAPAGAHFGLGLSIASDIAAAHGGVLELSNLEDVQGNAIGARAALILPGDRGIGE